MIYSDIENSLKDESSTLVISPVENVTEVSNSIVGYFSEKNVPGMYICFNKPYKAVKTDLENNSIGTKNVFFIDCISSAIGNVKKTENMIYLESPADLTGLNIAITDFNNKIKESKFLVIDALTTLLIYNREDIVIRFVRSVLAQSSASKTNVVVVTPMPKSGNFINKISLFFDNIVTL